MVKPSNKGEDFITSCERNDYNSPYISRFPWHNESFMTTLRGPVRHERLYLPPSVVVIQTEVSLKMREMEDCSPVLGDITLQDAI